MPILGVCLGMQALAHTHGGRVVRAPEPIHGRLSEIEHSGHPLFAGLPSGACDKSFLTRHSRTCHQQHLQLQFRLQAQV